MKQSLLKIVALSLGLGAFCAIPAAQAALLVTNGDFETGIADEATVANVTGWFSVTTGNFFDNTWHDSRNAEVPTDSQSGFSGEAAAALSGNPATTDVHAGSWLYQSIGTDSTVTSFDVEFDFGDFQSAATFNRDLGLTVGVYEWDGTGVFVPANNTDVRGASGVTLLDFASLIPPNTAGATLVINETETLDVSAQNGGQLFLRFNNFEPDGNGESWIMLDNVAVTNVVPEPGTFAMVLGGFGMLLGFQRSRRRRA